MDFCIFNYHIVKKDSLYCLNKLGIRKLYQIQIFEKYRKPISQMRYEEFFSNIDFEWKSIVLVSTGLDFPSISPRSAIFGFLDDVLEHKLLLNHISIIFKKLFI